MDGYGFTGAIINYQVVGLGATNAHTITMNNGHSNIIGTDEFFDQFGVSSQHNSMFFELVLHVVHNVEMSVDGNCDTTNGQTSES